MSDHGDTNFGIFIPLEYYSALTRKGTLTPATIWRKLENMVPSEIASDKGQILYDSCHTGSLEDLDS